jgi:hypothetical protein
MIKVTIPEEGVRGAFVVWMKHIESLNFFLDTPLEADGVNTGRTRLTFSRKQHTRRRGPSDSTPMTVAASSVDWLYDPTLKSGNALPGRPIVLKTVPADGVPNEQRQFTLVGRAIDFQEYFEDKMKYDTYVYFSEGGRHTFLKEVVDPSNV